MTKITYRCPYEENCSLRKHCTALRTSEELKEPMSIWILCPEVKRDTGGQEKERLVIITEHNKVA
jgi:hypothetical protein